MFNLGVILYTCICGVGPFQVEDGMSKEVETRMLNGTFIRSPYLSEFLLHLMERMFEVTPSKRITIPEMQCLIERCVQI